MLDSMRAQGICATFAGFCVEVHLKCILKDDPKLLKVFCTIIELPLFAYNRVRRQGIYLLTYRNSSENIF